MCAHHPSNFKNDVVCVRALIGAQPASKTSAFVGGLGEAKAEDKLGRGVAGWGRDYADGLR